MINCLKLTDSFIKIGHSFASNAKVVLKRPILKLKTEFQLPGHANP